MKITITKTCPFCHKTHSVIVDETAYQRWQLGILLAQEAFPDMSATEREQLISGLCPKCQDSIFDLDEEEG